MSHGFGTEDHRRAGRQVRYDCHRRPCLHGDGFPSRPGQAFPATLSGECLQIYRQLHHPDECLEDIQLCGSAHRRDGYLRCALQAALRGAEGALRSGQVRAGHATAHPLLPLVGYGAYSSVRFGRHAQGSQRRRTRFRGRGERVRPAHGEDEGDIRAERIPHRL